MFMNIEGYRFIAMVHDLTMRDKKWTFVRSETWVTERSAEMGYTFRPKGAERRMPGKESSVMNERMRFVIRLKDGEAMASRCRGFGISRTVEIIMCSTLNSATECA